MHVSPPTSQKNLAPRMAMTLQEAEKSGENLIVAQDRIIQASALPRRSQIVTQNSIHLGL